MKDTRLQKFVSDCGLMSRRAAEKEIEAGKFTVNGVVATLGTKIDTENDVVEYKGKIVDKIRENGYIYIMLNKPKGYLSSASDDRGRACVTELCSELGERVYPVGRLDYNSEGLLLLTNDGAFTEKMTHPKHSIPKIYKVRLKGAVTDKDIERLSSPMVIDGYEIMPVKCRVLEKTETSTVIEMKLYEGRNRQIRKMCEKVGLTVRALKRIAIGDVTLGTLPSGRWKFLTAAQVKYLLNAAE